MSLTVECKVTVYERNGRELIMSESESLLLTSHWNRDMVVFHLPDGSTRAVDRSDLERAVAAIGKAQP